MAGTKEGGEKAAATNKQRYGLNFYKQIGHQGGKISRGGGFAVSHEAAAEAGRKGGLVSAGRVSEEYKAEILRLDREGKIIADIARDLELKYSTVKRIIDKHTAQAR